MNLIDKLKGIRVHRAIRRGKERKVYNFIIELNMLHLLNTDYSILQGIKVDADKETRLYRRITRLIAEYKLSDSKRIQEELKKYRTLNSHF